MARLHMVSFFLCFILFCYVAFFYNIINKDMCVCVRVSVFVCVKFESLSKGHLALGAALIAANVNALWSAAWVLATIRAFFSFY